MAEGQMYTLSLPRGTGPKDLMCPRATVVNAQYCVLGSGYKGSPSKSHDTSSEGDCER